MSRLMSLNPSVHMTSQPGLVRILRVLKWKLLIAVSICVIWMGLSAANQMVFRPYHVLAHVINDPHLGLTETWDAYQHIFYRFETKHLSRTFLAAMVYELSGGRQWHAVPWQIRLSLKPWDMVRPIHDSFGLMHFTQQGFIEASQYCLRHHQPVKRKKWYEFGGCPANLMKTRGSAMHSVELAAASMQWFIDHQVLFYNKVHSLEDLRALAVIRHLCGAAFAERFISSGFQLLGIHSCAGLIMSELLVRVSESERRLTHTLTTAS